MGWSLSGWEEDSLNERSEGTRKDFKVEGIGHRENDSWHCTRPKD